MNPTGTHSCRLQHVPFAFCSTCGIVEISTRDGSKPKMDLSTRPKLKFSLQSLVAVILLFAILVPGSGMAGSVGGGSDALPIVEWTLDAGLSAPRAEAAESGVVSLGAGNFTSLVDRLRNAGLSVVLSPPPRGNRTDRFCMKISGKGGLEDFRRILHEVMRPEINLIGQVTEMEIEGGDILTRTVEVILDSNPSTGYAWRILGGGAFVEGKATEYQMHTFGYGVRQRQILHLKRVEAGAGPIRLVYRRAWEETPIDCRLTLRLSFLPARIDLSDPKAPARPEPPPTRPYVREEVFPEIKANGLPSRWDWRSQGIVTPVRDQGHCGSCWAFGTVGVMESALWKNGVANKDLSEQFLVSCNRDDWNCEDGGLTAHKYHYNTLGINQTCVGAVRETDKPYTATNGSCDSAYNHPHVLTGWQFVTGSEWTVPTVDQIKSAIHTYGPITAGVCVGDAFSYYDPNTIFAVNENVCGGSTNHQIILVGWDDPEKYWILRNSWGTGWGESGYMRIRWNTSRVGEGTSWVATPAAAANRFPPGILLLLLSE